MKLKPEKVVIEMLRAAANVIEQQDKILSAQGRGLNLSNVPFFEGANFPDQLVLKADDIERIQESFFTKLPPTDPRSLRGGK